MINQQKNQQDIEKMACSIEKTKILLKDINDVIIKFKIENRGRNIIGGGESLWSIKKNGTYIRCLNDFCYSGGFDFFDEINNMKSKNKEENSSSKFCSGNEGSPKGRRLGRSCLYKIEYTIKIIKRENQ